MPTPGAIGPIAGRRVLITGATNGIGLAAAVELGRRGAQLVLVGRSAERLADAKAQVAATGAAVEVEACDFAELASIRALGQRLRDAGAPIDVLLNNAGAMHQTRKHTADGFEMTFGVNHLGYVATTLALLPLLRAAPAARVVNVASDAHRMGQLDLDDLQAANKAYSAWGVYGTSKLCNILFTRSLARRLQGTAITANSLHPGVVATGFGRNDPGLFARLAGWAGGLLLSPERGAATSVHLCASPEVDGVTGRYFARCREVSPRKPAQDDAAAEALWARSAAMLGLPADGLPLF